MAACGRICEARYTATHQACARGFGAHVYQAGANYGYPRRRIPAAYIAEFEKLQDQAPPIPFEELLPQIEEDIGGCIDEIFAYVDRQPLAAASIAQVHKALLKDGTAVILKVRRPGLRKIIEADLRLLQRIVDIAESEEPELRRFHPRNILRQFNQSLRRELDLASEGRNSEQVALNLSGDANIRSS